MDSFSGKLAVITGGGTGMGRELAIALAGDGANLALCDVNVDNLAATAARCVEVAPGCKVSTHACDVSDPEQVEGFAAEVLREHETDHINLLFNNAGIAGTPSFVNGDRDDWERTFNVCWNGVYNCSRAFMPLLVASDEGHIINTSSINGLWASIGPSRPHSAYCAAKFAVRGFTEALVVDLRLNAPHVKASVVFPGHIGTEIVANTAHSYSGQVNANAVEASNNFRNNAPTTASEAATVILDGVRAGDWRILIGDDAHVVDSMVRDEPEAVYEPEFAERMRSMGALERIVN